jgi:molybdopterin-binding protein
MKLSARNMLKGKIVEVKKGQTTAHVRIDIGGSIVTSSITNEAVDELKLAAGQTAYAVVNRDRLTAIPPRRARFCWVPISATPLN